MNIHTYFSLTDYIDLNQSYHEWIDSLSDQKTIEFTEHSKTVEKRERYQQNIKVLREAFISFLIERGKKDPWKPIDGSEHHQNPLKNSWKKLMNQENLTEEDKNNLFHYFEKTIEFNLIDHKGHVENGLKELLEVFNSGCFLFSSMERCHCNDCGCVFFLEIKDWHCKFTDYKGHVLNDQQPCFEDKIQTLELNFKTGHLIAIDDLKSEELLEIVSYNNDYKDLSIDYPAGRIASTKHFAEKYGFIKVNTTSDASIYLKDNFLIIGDEILDEPEEWDHQKNDEGQENSPSLSQHIQGHIVCDSYSVTLIDEENLFRLFEQISPNKTEAQKLMKNFLEEENPLKIKIEPGNYRLSFYHNSEDFAEKYHNEEEEMPKNFSPYFTLKKIPELKANFKIEQNPRKPKQALSL